MTKKEILYNVRQWLSILALVLVCGTCLLKMQRSVINRKLDEIKSEIQSIDVVYKDTVVNVIDIDPALNMAE